MGMSKKKRRSWKCGGKVRYSDKQQADAALRLIHQAPRERFPVRPYECHVCNGWHLTAQAKRAR